MSIYTLVKTKTCGKSCTAHVLTRKGVETTMNAYDYIKDGKNFKEVNRFKDIPWGSLFWCHLVDDEFVYEKIEETDIPRIEEIEAKQEQDHIEAVLRLRAERIATGRFIYEETKNKDGKVTGQIQREILSKDSTQFLQAMAERINSEIDQWPWKSWGNRVHGTPPYSKMTVAEVLQQDERMLKFLSLAEPGDVLELVNWDGGFMAASTDFVIRRNDSMFVYNISVS